MTPPCVLKARMPHEPLPGPTYSQDAIHCTACICIYPYVYTPSPQSYIFPCVCASSYMPPQYLYTQHPDASHVLIHPPIYLYVIPHPQP